MKIDLSCPVELWHFKLPTAEDPTVRLQLFNLGPVKVTAVMAEFLCFDKDGGKMSRQTEKVSGLQGGPHSAFEMRAAVEDGTKAAAMDFIIRRVWLEDGSIWRHHQQNLVEYADNRLPRGKELAQLRAVAGEDALGYPGDRGELWVCVCGRPNRAGDASCARCGRDKHDTFTANNEAVIRTMILEKEAAEEERARREREENERRQREEEEKKKRRARRVCRRILGASCALAAVLLAAGVYFYALPAYRYYQADIRLKMGEYERAHAEFEKLGDYRDAKERVREADYESARAAMKTGTLTSLRAAESEFVRLSDYADSAKMALEARYLRAGVLMDAGSFEDAVSEYEGILGYRDAEEKVSECHYRWAVRLAEGLQYEAAREKFLALGDYGDAKDRALLCLTEPAMTAIEEKDFEKALGLIEKTPENTPVRARIKELNYLRGEQLFDEGLWDEAAERFLLAGDWRDAWRRATECLYRPALEKMRQGEYLQAKDMFDKISTFEDAAALSLQCSYYLGEEAAKKGEWERAVGYFEEASGVKAAGQALKEALYHRAGEREQSGDYLGAADDYRRAGDFGDAPALHDNARYTAGKNALDKNDYDTAVEAFLQLDAYRDSGELLRRALYARADAALLAGDFQAAVRQFAALSGYEDADGKLKEAEYRAARDSMQRGEFAAAANAFLSLGDYLDADSQYKECTYLEAARLEEKGENDKAAEVLAGIPDYKDAAERVYRAADKMAKEGDAAHAARLFALIGEYEDAPARADNSYDDYYRESYQKAEEAMKARRYKEAAEALENLDRVNPPEKFSDVGDRYNEAVYRLAEQLYEEEKPYEALPYYRLISDYKDVKSRKLTRNAYRIIGRWESTKGMEMVFGSDGTCLIDGKEMCYAALQYRLKTGNTADNLQYTYNITHMTDNSLTLRNEKTKKLYKMTRMD